MNPVDRLIEKFGSQERLAQAAGVTQGAVSQWRIKGLVPAKRQRVLLQNASAAGVELSPADFFEAEPAA